MQIKLNFSNPISISPLEKRDVFVLHIKQPELFFSPEVKRFIHKDW